MPHFKCPITKISISSLWQKLSCCEKNYPIPGSFAAEKLYVWRMQQQHGNPPDELVETALISVETAIDNMPCVSSSRSEDLRIPYPLLDN